MYAYIIRRLLFGVFIIWGVYTITFFAVNLAPGDPFTGNENAKISEADLDRLAAYKLGFRELADAIRRWSIDLPAGTINSSSGPLVVRTKGQAYRQGEFERIPVRSSGGADVLLEDVAKTAGLDPAALLEAIARQETKDRLRATTQDLIDRGGFGSPTIFVDATDMYFGNDRLPLIEAALHA